jgi:geranylgeranyl pyrophosphate synthase
VAAAPTLDQYLDELRHLIERALPEALPRTTSPALVIDAMEYALMGGGKRLRPCLTLAAADAVASRCGIDHDTARALALPSACAIEMVHTYSLVHDDLPAMDDDALRRGRATTHVVYGDGMAILAGDGLLTEAFALLARTDPALPQLSDDRRIALITQLATAAGAPGMVGGQAVDLTGAGRVRDRTLPPFDRPALEDMHARKTGALIRAATVMGAIAAGADTGIVRALDDYAREIGLAFQIVDDLLDVEGSNDALGKTAGKDAASGKPTYPSIVGLDVSRALAADCVARAKIALAREALSGRLDDIADWSLSRRK